MTLLPENWSIKKKILTPSIGGLLLLGVTLFSYFMSVSYNKYEIHQSALHERTVGMLKNAVEYPIFSGNVSEIEALLDYLIKEPEIHEITVVNKDGKVVISRSDSADVNSKFLSTTVHDVFSGIALPGVEGNEKEGIEGQREVIGKIEITMSRKEAYDAFLNEAIMSCLMFLLLLVAVFLFCLLAIRSVSDGTDKILNGIIKYQRGEDFEEIIVPGKNELSKIGAQLNQMVKELDMKNKSITAQQEELIQAHERQNAFMSSISHDLRSPLGLIVFACDQLREMELKPLVMSLVNNCRTASSQLETLVTDLIDQHRISKFGEEIVNSRFDLAETVKNLFRSNQEEAEKKDVRFNVDVELGEEFWVESDEPKIIRILSNVLSNAVKFTDSGAISGKVRVVKEQDHQLLNIVIKDSGIGIEQDMVETITSPFVRAVPKDKIIAGSGLGLSIVQQLISILGGTIKIESAVNIGTSVTLSIPISKVTQTRQRKMNFEEVDSKVIRLNVDNEHKKKILILDDMREYREAFELCLVGNDITLTETGEECISVFSEEEFAVVLVDCHLPGISGFEVVERLREIEREQHRQGSRIIAVTANAVPEAMQRAYKVGVDDFVGKPFRKEELARKVDHWINGGKKDRRQRK